MPSNRLVRFDWAIKNILRNKANYDILEGFLSALLEDESLTVLEILESETNQDDESDKFNRTDVVVKDGKGRKILIEIQNTRESDYFYRMVYNVSKHISQSLEKGEKYSQIDKVILVNIVYFDLGIGEDYLYYGQTEFIGLNTGEKINKNSPRVQHLIPKGAQFNSLEIFPEYYLIQVLKYQDKVKRAIDEWIYWLKNERVNEQSRSRNIDKVSKKLDLLKMSPQQRAAYERYLERLASEQDMIETAKDEGFEEGYNRAKEEFLEHIVKKEKQLEQERKEKEEIKIKTVLKFYDKSFTIEEIAETLNLSLEEVIKIL